VWPVRYGVTRLRGLSVKAIAMVPMRGWGNAWGVAKPSDPPGRVEDRVVTLEIQGNAADGYHLIISPAGCFTADTWHESVEDAKATAAEAFGVLPHEWS